MRILLACEFFYPSVGGVQEVVRQVAQRLVARGHTVTVATSHIPSRTRLELDGVRIVEFKVAGNLVRGLSGAVDEYRDYVVNGAYDVFMVKAAQQWTLDALIPVLDRVPRKVFVPCGFSRLRDPAYADYYRDMPETLGKFDHLIFYASNYRDINMARAHGLSNFSIVPNGASELEFGAARDRGFRRRHGIDEEVFVVLTVGTFTGEKGHLELAEAFLDANLGGGPALLILNGNSPSLAPRTGRRTAIGTAKGLARRFRSALRRSHQSRTDAIGTVRVIVDVINRLAPTKRAMIVNLPRAEVVQAYFNSDLFVLASNIEYSPLVLYEAAAAGLPFLTVPVGNAEEIVGWTGGGAVCPAPQDDRGYTRVVPEVLGEHISRLAADRASLRAFGEAGHDAWSRNFTWDKITDQYEAILSDVARRVDA